MTGIGVAATAVAPVIQSFAGLPQWTAVALIAAGLIVAAYVVLRSRTTNITLQP